MHMHTKMHSQMRRSVRKESPAFEEEIRVGSSWAPLWPNLGALETLKSYFAALEMLHWAQSEQLHNLNTEKLL